MTHAAGQQIDGLTRSHPASPDRWRNSCGQGAARRYH